MDNTQRIYLWDKMKALAEKVARDLPESSLTKKKLEEWAQKLADDCAKCND